MSDLSIIVLAGGKSSRMGEDKGLMTLYDKPMVEYVLDIAKELTDNIIVSSNNANYEKFGYPVVKDQFESKGPLAGIYAGLEKSETELNVVISCDVPYVTRDLIRYLIEKKESFDIVVPIREEMIHPLIGVYMKSAKNIIESQLKSDELKVTDCFRYLDVKYVNTDMFDKEIFHNINSKQDVK